MSLTDDPHIRSYGSFDEMMADMAVNEEAANLHMHPNQAAIKPGAWVMKVEIFYGAKIFILGKTRTEDESVEAERRACLISGDPFSEKEFRQHFKKMDERGYLTGEWYSVGCPEGELGDAHRSTVLAEIPEFLFDVLLELVQGKA